MKKLLLCSAGRMVVPIIVTIIYIGRKTRIITWIDAIWLTFQKQGCIVISNRVHGNNAGRFRISA